MPDIDEEINKERTLYRELFINADKSFKEIIAKLKQASCGKNCIQCCKVRYSKLSPTEIYEMTLQGDIISNEYIEYFLPYGAPDNFCYKSKPHINMNDNNTAALSAEKEYTSLLLNKNDEPVYFYYCKNLKDNKCGSEQKGFTCRSFPASVTTILPSECYYREWQKQVLDKINNEIIPDIYKNNANISRHRKNYTCKKTGTCCKLACSEYSLEELKNKGNNGDNFAEQFSKTFVPYTSIEDVRKIYPEYVDFVLSKLEENEKIYFYYCPALSKDNLCTKYETRPDICRDFPENPLSILPKSCGFYNWKEDVTVASLTYHAMMQISEFYQQKIQNSLCD